MELSTKPKPNDRICFTLLLTTMILKFFSARGTPFSSLARYFHVPCGSTGEKATMFKVTGWYTANPFPPRHRSSPCPLRFADLCAVSGYGDIDQQGGSTRRGDDSEGAGWPGKPLVSKKNTGVADASKRCDTHASTRAPHIIAVRGTSEPRFVTDRFSSIRKITPPREKEREARV